MRIPDCYDPVFQEERRQAAFDRRAEGYPVCGCCFRRICPGGRYYELSVGGQPVKVCAGCKGVMEINQGLVEL